MQLHPNSKIVDLGCGFGETSLILASAGHEVHSIEPAQNRCKALSQSLKNLGLAGYTYVCTAEDLDKIPLKNLEGALFSSSLHHCDHPLKALKNARKILGPKGVIVINEPILKFYRTKEWFYKQLLENPVKMGHYGGNEHILIQAQNENLGRVKASGLNDRKQPHISNIVSFTIVQSRELSRWPKFSF